MAEKVRKIERAVLVILGVGMTVIMFINACGRYLLGSTLLWAEETVRICFVWAMFIAITDLFVTGEHIGFDVIAMKNRLTKIIACVGTNLVLIFLGVNLVFFGMEIIHTTGRVPLPATKETSGNGVPYTGNDCRRSMDWYRFMGNYTDD